MRKVLFLAGGLSLLGCHPQSEAVNNGQVQGRGINNPCIDNPNSGSSLCADHSQNLAMIPPVELAPTQLSSSEIVPG